MFAGGTRPVPAYDHVRTPCTETLHACIRVASPACVGSVAVLPALSIVLGVLAGLLTDCEPRVFVAPIVAAVFLAALAWAREWTRVTTGALVVGFAACGAANAAFSRERALDTPLRSALDAEFGGFGLASLGPGG